eukprot:Clim_evm21s242 gene=Clim_evmTU21s242
MAPKKTAVLQFDFITENQSELSVKKGDKISILAEPNPNWGIYQNNRGEIGFVPTSYVKGDSKGGLFSSLRRSGSNREKKGQHSDDNLSIDSASVRKFESNMKKAVDGKKILATALSDFTPRRADELKLVAGEEVAVVEQEDDGWWCVLKDNRMGWVPGNHLLEGSRTRYDLQDNIRCLDKLTTLYAFHGNGADELSFEVGEELSLVHLTSQYWWTAMNSRGDYGLIPANYTKRSDGSVVEYADSSAVPNAGGMGTGGPTGGQVPQAPARTGNLSDLPYYRSKMSKKECEAALAGKRDGTFLIRDSERSEGDLSLSIAADGAVKHFRITRSPDGGFVIGKTRKFQSLPELVDFYQRTSILEKADGTLLAIGMAYLG